MDYPQPIDYQDIDKSLKYDKIKITDNFLPESQFSMIQESIIGTSEKRSIIDFTYRPTVVDPKLEKYGNGKVFQFISTLYSQRGGVEAPMSREILGGIMERLNPISLMYVKINAIPKTDKVYQHPWHTDYLSPNDKKKMDSLHKEGLDFKFNESTEFKESNLGKSMSSLYYMNTTDGPTMFKDGTAVECIANRLVTFPVYYIHASTTPTNQNVRFVMNLNYL